jgi:hypothetical protein
MREFIKLFIIFSVLINLISAFQVDFSVIECVGTIKLTEYSHEAWMNTQEGVKDKLPYKTGSLIPNLRDWQCSEKGLFCVKANAGLAVAQFRFANVEKSLYPNGVNYYKKSGIYKCTAADYTGYW